MGLRSIIHRRCKRTGNSSVSVITGTSLIVGTMLFLLLSMPKANAHNLDPDSMDRFSEILLGAESGQFYYIVYYGMNETKRAFEVLLDKPGGDVVQENVPKWIEKVGPGYLNGVEITLDSHPLKIELRTGRANLAIGHGGVTVIAVALVGEFSYEGHNQPGKSLSFIIEDKNFQGPRSWMQMRAVGLEGVQIEGHQPYEDLEPFNYVLLDNQNFLPGTRRLELEIRFPDAGDAAAGIPANATGALSYGPETYERLAEPIGFSKDRYGEVKSLKKILMGSCAVFLLGVLAVIIVRLKKQQKDNQHPIA